MLLMDGYFTPRTEQGASFDGTSSTGIKWSWYCPFEKAEILEVGLIYGAASGAVTTGAVVTVNKTTLAGVTAAIRSWAIFTAVATMPVLSSVFIDLDLGVNKNSPVRGEIDYPDMLRGERLDFNLTTQGVDGTQTLVPVVIYREKEVDTR